jgi:microcystin-dependent protein
MQKYKVVNQANADGTAKDGTINDPTSGTKITASFLNDNFFNIFSFLENAGYTLIDDDLSQLTKALKGRYVSTYTYNTSSITTQSVNDVVLGSDNKYYEVQNNNVTNDDPVGSVTGNWVLTSFDANETGTPVGGIIATAQNTITLDGYLYCNGQTINRVTYSGLFSKIGTIFGVGNGSTTFNLPDSRGVFLRGLDDGRGLDSGRAFGSYQEDSIQNHGHDIFGGTGGKAGMNNDYPAHSSGYVDGKTASVVGANTSNETRPKNIAIKYFIKY